MYSVLLVDEDETSLAVSKASLKRCNYEGIDYITYDNVISNAKLV